MASLSVAGGKPCPRTGRRREDLHYKACGINALQSAMLTADWHSSCTVQNTTYNTVRNTETDLINIPRTAVMSRHERALRDAQANWNSRVTGGPCACSAAGFASRIPVARIVPEVASIEIGQPPGCSEESERMRRKPWRRCVRRRVRHPRTIRFRSI
jgi:hypothetical protein